MKRFSSLILVIAFSLNTLGNCATDPPTTNPPSSPLGKNGRSPFAGTWLVNSANDINVVAVVLKGNLKSGVFITGDDVKHPLTIERGEGGEITATSDLGVFNIEVIDGELIVTEGNLTVFEGEKKQKPKAAGNNNAPSSGAGALNNGSDNNSSNDDSPSNSNNGPGSIGSKGGKKPSSDNPPIDNPNITEPKGTSDGDSGEPVENGIPETPSEPTNDETNTPMGAMFGMGNGPPDIEDSAPEDFAPPDDNFEPPMGGMGSLNGPGKFGMGAGGNRPNPEDINSGNGDDESYTGPDTPTISPPSAPSRPGGSTGTGSVPSKPGGIPTGPGTAPPELGNSKPPQQDPVPDTPSDSKPSVGTGIKTGAGAIGGTLGTFQPQPPLPSSGGIGRTDDSDASSLLFSY